MLSLYYDARRISVEKSEVHANTNEMFVVDTNWPDQFTLPMVFFGTADGGHSYLLMDGKDPENGTVYFWERTDPFGTDDNAKGFGRVANSLPEFFFNLTSADNL